MSRYYQVLLLTFFVGFAPAIVMAGHEGFQPIPSAHNFYLATSSVLGLSGQEHGTTGGMGLQMKVLIGYFPVRNFNIGLLGITKHGSAIADQESLYGIGPQFTYFMNGTEPDTEVKSLLPHMAAAFLYYGKHPSRHDIIIEPAKPYSVSQWEAPRLNSRWEEPVYGWRLSFGIVNRITARGGITLDVYL